MQFDQNGFHFSDENESAAMVNSYAELKNVKVHAFLVTKMDYKILVLYDLKNNSPIYESLKVEDIGVHIDMLAMLEQ